MLDCTHHLRIWSGILALIFAVFNAPVYAAQITVYNAATELQEKVHYLNAVIDIELSEEQVSALQNGLAIPMKIETEVYRKRSWWVDKLIVKIDDQYRLKYQPLTELYQIEHINSGRIQRENSLQDALDTVGIILRKTLLDENSLNPEHEYSIRLRMRINREMLPVPLQSETLLDPDWNLSSEWFEWELKR